MERAQEFRQSQAKEGNKRRQDEQASEDKKRRSFKRVFKEDGTEVTSPAELLSSQERTR